MAVPTAVLNRIRQAVREGTPVIRSLPGQQRMFANTKADIAVFGGKAGPGKSFALLLIAMEYTEVSGFRAVIFRRTYPEITNAGGLWDSSFEIYGGALGNPNFGRLEWGWPTGAKVKFAHMQHEDDRFQWDGSQIPYIAFDQLEHFTERMFFYMLSRNRTTCGVRPFIRATANPDPESWLRHFIRWWIDDETGLAITERSGVIRWFVNLGLEDDDWGASKQELVERHGEQVNPKSFTFIHGELSENTILLEKNPGYMASLEAMPEVDRERLVRGNWNAKEAAGMFFRREYFEIIPAAPTGDVSIRYWDRAATEEKPTARNQSATAGCKMRRCRNGLFVIDDVVRFFAEPSEVEQHIKNVASQDGTDVLIGIEQDPAQAGKMEAQYLIKQLAGYSALANPVRERKGIRARPLAGQARIGNVKLVVGPWNETFIREAENFDGSDKCQSDQIDAASGAFHMLTNLRIAGTWGT